MAPGGTRTAPAHTMSRDRESHAARDRKLSLGVRPVRSREPTQPDQLDPARTFAPPRPALPLARQGPGSAYGSLIRLQVPPAPSLEGSAAVRLELRAVPLASNPR